MVDVGAKPETSRRAVATAAVRMSPATLALVERGGADSPGSRPGKGDVLAVARVAALQGLKHTAALIPLCHPVRVVGSDVELWPDRDLPGLRIRVTVRAFDRTGVEMEAMTGATLAALTVYDMVKGQERGVEIVSVRLEEKSGGASGLWRRESAARELAVPAEKARRAAVGRAKGKVGASRVVAASRRGRPA